MKIDNSYFGGFVVSKNVIDKHQPIRYSFREKSLYDKLNGWTIYSALDDDEYVANPSNFVIVNATTLFTIVPVFYELYEAPYGTDICWMYEKGVLTGFYDLVNNEETDIKRILEKRINYIGYFVLEYSFVV